MNQPYCLLDRIWLWPDAKNRYQAPSTENLPNASYVKIDSIATYTAFCDDFGPMNLASVYKFSAIIESYTSTIDSDIVFVSAPDKRAMTNAVFLLGSYTIMKRGYTPDKALRLFDGLKPWLTSYRDVSAGEQNLHLLVSDCWEGLYQAKQLSWVSFEGGAFELSDYEHCDSPLNADLHEVVPGKFVAMRGPIALKAGRSYQDRVNGARDFSPAYVAHILRQYNVRVVVRLNEPRRRAAGRRTGSGRAWRWQTCPLIIVLRRRLNWWASSSPSPRACRGRWRCTARRG